jgi:UDP-N-acetylmuramoylalanine--D-glutamate ligase
MKIAILGFGKEGQSAYRYFDKPENEIFIHDNNLDVELPEDVESVLGEDAFINLDSYKYDLLVRSPGLRLSEETISTQITTPTNEFFKACKAEIIGVTGTKGKGTTCTLISEILIETGRKVHLLGNIGAPALDELDSIDKDDLVVYEMSSFQLFDIQKSPHVAVCLMVTEDHLDWHKDLNEYHEAKRNIFSHQNSSDVAVYFAGNEVSKDLASSSKASTKYSYGQSGDVYVKDDKIFAFNKLIADTEIIKLPGRHNLENICAAIAAVWVYTQDDKAIQKVLSTFIGLPYHIEHISSKDGIDYYNDSFSTNPSAAIAAVESFDRPQVLFLGGFDKNVNFNILAEVIKKHKMRQIITFAQTGARIKDVLTDHGIENVEFIDSDDFETIIKSGIKYVKSGDVVVFSPACASFGMFTDYKSRGEKFNKIIQSL